MAFLFTDPNEEEDQLNGAPKGTGGGGLLGGEAAPAGPAAEAAKPTTSGWTNLRSYLDANKDQAGDIADRVSGYVKNIGDQSTAAVDKGVADYGSELSKATSLDPGALASRATADPISFSKNPGDVSALKNFQSGSFKGPGAFETTPGYGAAAAAAEKGASTADLAKTEAGKKTFLKTLEPNLSQGGVELDNLLLAGVPGANDRLQSVAAPYANLRGYLGGKTTAADAARDKGVADFETGREAVRTGFTEPAKSSLNDLESSINSRVGKASSEDFNANQSIGNLQTFLSGGAALPDADASLFRPEGANTGIDSSALGAAARDVLKSKGASVSSDPEGDSAKITSAILNGNIDSLPQHLRATASELAADPTRFSADPLTKLRSENVTTDPNWLSTYFPGATRSAGTPSPGSLASPDERAKILALQDLIDGSSSYLSPDESDSPYVRASTARYRPTIQKITPPAFYPS